MVVYLTKISTAPAVFTIGDIYATLEGAKAAWPGVAEWEEVSPTKVRSNTLEDGRWVSVLAMAVLE